MCEPRALDEDSMKVKVERITKHDFLGVAVVHMMTEATKNTEDFCKKFNVVAGANSEVDLVLTVNGVEVNFEHFMKQLERQHNTMVEESAKEQLKEKTFNMLDRLNTILKQAEEAVTEEIETTFPGRKVW